MPRIISKTQDFLKYETSAGFVLMGVAVLALIASNSPVSEFYYGFLDLPLDGRRLAQPSRGHYSKNNFE